MAGGEDRPENGGAQRDAEAADVLVGEEQAENKQAPADREQHGCGGEAGGIEAAGGKQLRVQER